MKTKIFYFILSILTLLFLFIACEDSTGNNNTPPGKVILVEKSAEDALIETGIDAEYVLNNDRNGIFLHWYSVKDEDLAAYDIYRSSVDSTSGFQRIATIPKVLNNVDTFYVDKSSEVFPQSGMQALRYYYYVVARDEGGLVGERSRVDNYRLEEFSTLNSPNSTSTFDSTFKWNFPAYSPHHFVFRIMKQDTTEPFFVRMHQSKYFLNQEWTMFELGLNQLAPGTYLWRIDIIGPDSEGNNGSESDWLGFQVQ